MKVLATLLLLCLAVPASAHVNSPHAYREATVAGHEAVVVVHLPRSVPGEAEAQIRLLDLADGEVPEILFRQVPPQGEDHAPSWIPARRSEADRAFWTAPMPLMVFGLFEAEFLVRTPSGEGTVRVPLTARNPSPLPMGAGLVASLAALTAFLLGTAFVIMRTVVADARRDPALPRTPREARHGLLAGAGAAVAFAGFVAFTGFTWHAMHRSFVARTAPALDAAWLVKSGTPRVGHPLQAVVLLTRRDGSAATDLLEEHGERVHVTFVESPGAQHVAHVHGRETAPGTFEVWWTPRVAGRHVVFVDAATREAGELTIVQEIVVGPAFGEPAAALPVAPPPDPFPALGEARAGAGPSRVTWPDLPAVRAGDVVQLAPQVDGPAGSAEIIVLRDDFQVFTRLRPSADGGMRFAYGFPQPGLYRLVLTAPSPGGDVTSALDLVVGG